jgi:hypothetical protein
MILRDIWRLNLRLVLANYRLAPDMFCLIEQIQSSCDAAKFCAAYLTQTTAPKHEDTETTWVEMRTPSSLSQIGLKVNGRQDLKNSFSL